MTRSVLDFFCALADSIYLAREAERFGYRRYWLGEHHSGAQCPNPLLASAIIAARTQCIRVGSGAVLFRTRRPLMLAEDAGLLQLATTGRFDLGVTSGLGLDGAVYQALTGRQEGHCSPGPETDIAELVGFCTGRFASDHPFPESLRDQYVQANESTSAPPIWVAGLSEESAARAGRFGLGFVYSTHHAGGPNQADPRVLRTYREEFQPSNEFPHPYVILVVSGLAIMTKTRLVEGFSRLTGIASRPNRFSPEQLTFLGTPGDCVTPMLNAIDRFRPDELMILQMSVPPAGPRERSEWRAEAAEVYRALGDCLDDATHTVP